MSDRLVRTWVWIVASSRVVRRRETRPSLTIDQDTARHRHRNANAGVIGLARRRIVETRLAPIVCGTDLRRARVTEAPAPTRWPRGRARNRRKSSDRLVPTWVCIVASSRVVRRRETRPLLTIDQDTARHRHRNAEAIGRGLIVETRLATIVCGTDVGRARVTDSSGADPLALRRARNRSEGLGPSRPASRDPHGSSVLRQATSRCWLGRRRACAWARSTKKNRRQECRRPTHAHAASCAGRGYVVEQCAVQM